MSERADGASSPQQKPTAPLDVQVDICGTAYTLRFSILALRAFRDLWECATDKDVFTRLDAMRPSDIPDYLWALTRRHHPELSRRDCDLLADDGDKAEMGKAIGQLLVRQGRVPAAKKKPEAPERPRLKRRS